MKNRLQDTRANFEKDYAKHYGTAGFAKPAEQKQVDMEGTLVEINSPEFSNDGIDKVLFQCQTL